MAKRLNPSIAVIGGGTGSFTLLNDLKRKTKNITALVNMVDDGGSTGVLRDELGVLPPGDVRQCLVALSESSSSLRMLFNYRFPSETTFAGHSFGNLFLSAVEKMTDDFGEAISLASEVLNITGRVVPITLDNCQLVLHVGPSKVVGEYKISNTNFGDIKPALSLNPRAKINPVAETAIKNAELVVIAPGNLYGSLIPALLVDGVAEALHSTPAKVAYVCNLINKPIQTKGFAVHDYVEELERFAGKGTIDYVLYNTDKPSQKLLDAYALDGEYPININENAFKKASYKTIGGHFLAHTPTELNTNDSFILRSLIRHDSAAVSSCLMDLLTGKN